MKTKSFRQLAMVAACASAWTFQQVGVAASLPAPEWTKNLVIYEIAPKAFTSPGGPESGTFDSLKARLLYLQELGITGIWLAGHAVSDPHHFYNIWTAYATVEPDQVDASLGTREQFRAMIAEAHARGIRIFLDVTTHGLVANSPIIQQHPEWFRGGTWEMIDYDWYGGHLDLDDWWVQTWTDYVVRDGVDGFRLDVNMYRPDLWARVRRNAANAGHPIVIFDETNAALPGVSDFQQHDIRLKAKSADILATNVPTYFARAFGHMGEYKVKVQYSDGTAAEGSSVGSGESLRVHLDGLIDDRVARRLGDYVGIDPFIKDNIKTAADVPRGDGIPDVRLSIDKVDAREIQNISVKDDLGQKWSLRGSVAWVLDAPVGFGVRPLVMEGEGPHRLLYLATLEHGYRSISLSCHDNDAYVAQGSRALFGYSFLFVPALPIFMSGEEFNATFHALPNLSPEVFGASDPGKGWWLYGSMLDWNELKVPSKRSMLDDVKRMLSIRRQQQAILSLAEAATEPALLPVSYTSDVAVPVPYMRWKGRAAIVVMANRDTRRDAHLILRIPFERLGNSLNAKYQVTDLWRGGRPRIYSANRLMKLAWTVHKDRSAGGGVGLLKVEVAN